MPEEDRYHNYEIRDRIDKVNERVIRVEGKQESHELVCAQRYAQILKDIAEVKATVTLVAKAGGIVGLALFMLELGKATFPALFELITKGHG